MLDYDDLDFAILALPATLIGMVIIVIVFVIVLGNDKGCSEMKCEGAAKPELLNHECLCVTTASPMKVK